MIIADHQRPDIYPDLSWQEICARIGRPYKTRSTGVLVALCCFHSEKTPSMHMWPMSGNFLCHGCGIRGNKIDFIRSYFPKYDIVDSIFRDKLKGGGKPCYPPDHPEFDFISQHYPS